MRLNHTSTYEDKTLEECRNFGGVAADAVSIVERLDSIIESNLDQIELLKAKVAELESEIEVFEAANQTNL